MPADVKTLLSAAFIEEEPKAKFLQMMFQTPDQFIFAGEKVQIDAVRGKEEYAIDVAPESGGRGNKLNVYTTKEYTPPEYDEYAYITAAQLQKRLPGRTIYEMDGNASYARDFADLFLESLTLLRNKIFRSIELQCRDALFFGKITLINGDVIDFKLKATHLYTTPVTWTNSSADPFADFGVIGGRVRKDGVKEIIDAVFGSAALSKFLNNQNVKESADLKQIERMAITSPMAADEGAKYHGTFSAEDYKINIWTYPQYVGIPTGFGLPNEGTKQPYIPEDRIVVLPGAPDFRLYYAGIPMLTTASSEIAAVTGLNEMPTMERGKMIPYAYLDKGARSVKVGVRSRPLAVPVEIDGVGVIIVT